MTGCSKGQRSLVAAKPWGRYGLVDSWRARDPRTSTNLAPGVRGKPGRRPHGLLQTLGIMVGGLMASSKPCHRARASPLPIRDPTHPTGTARAALAWPRIARSDRGFPTTARLLHAAGTTAGRPTARRAAAARMPLDSTR